MKLVIWISVVTLLSIIIFSGTVVRFHHFWEAWEFLAATTAAIYNLCFAVVLFALRHEKDEGTLHSALSDNKLIMVHLLLRVSLPTLFFIGTAMVILWDLHAGGTPVPPERVFLKLFLTVGGFVTILIGDFVTEHQLGGITKPNNRPPVGWMSYFRTRVWLIDLPFVVGYCGLIVIYATYRYDPIDAISSAQHALLVQAFVGGASALEMMIQSAIHGFSEVID
jgi:hypothetical protein